MAAGGVSDGLVAAYRSILTTDGINGSTAAITLSLPSQSELVQAIDEADPVLVHRVRGFVLRTLSQRLSEELVSVRIMFVWASCVHVVVVLAVLQCLDALDVVCRTASGATKHTFMRHRRTRPPNGPTK